MASAGSDQVLRYDGRTGAFLGPFASGGGLSRPDWLVFVPVAPGSLGGAVGAHLQLDASTLDFGALAVGATSAARSVTVTNTGGTLLTISSVGLTAANPADFAVTGGTGVTVPAGGTTTLAVTFEPTAGGSRSASLVITSDADNSPSTLSLAGTGVTPAPSASRLLVVSENTTSILRYDGTTGAFIDPLVPSGSGGLTDPGPSPLARMATYTSQLLSAILKYRRADRQLPWCVCCLPGHAPVGLAFGADGNLYVANHDAGNVLRLNGQTGASMGVFASGGGLTYSATVLFGPDGNLYVSSWHGNEIVRFNGQTGALIDVFVPPGSGGLDHPNGFTFGQDGNLYVCSFYTNAILRYSGQTGAFLGVFALAGGLSGPLGLAFGPDGNLYVSSHNTDSVLRYNGQTGAFVDAFVPAGSGGLSGPHVGLIFTAANGSLPRAAGPGRCDRAGLRSVALNTASAARSVKITN